MNARLRPRIATGLYIASELCGFFRGFSTFRPKLSRFIVLKWFSRIPEQGSRFEIHFGRWRHVPPRNEDHRTIFGSVASPQGLEVHHNHIFMPLGVISQLVCCGLVSNNQRLLSKFCPSIRNFNKLIQGSIGATPRGLSARAVIDLRDNFCAV